MESVATRLDRLRIALEEAAEELNYDVGVSARMAQQIEDLEADNSRLREILAAFLDKRKEDV
jgi:hypothetical protein